MELREGACFPRVLVGVNIGLAVIECVIAFLAFFQLMRIHARDSHLGWSRQKAEDDELADSSALSDHTENVTALMLSAYFVVFHFIIGSSNLGYFIYFVLTLVAACKGWLCWSHLCGFVVMACPKILFLVAFLLLLSFWVDLVHQSNDEDEDEEYSQYDTLLEHRNKPNSEMVNQRKCCSFRSIGVGSRQKVVILVTLLIFVLMVTSALLIWIGRGRNPIDSALVARVYVDLFAIAVLLLGGALTCYGLILFLKMRKVRSERASSEMWKVGGLAIVSVLCFTASSLVAILTDIPLLYHWHRQPINGAYTSLLLIVYYFLGSSVPSAFVLWVMRELPPPMVKRQQESTIAYISDDSVTIDPHRWTAVTTTQNQMQVSRASPI